LEHFHRWNKRPQPRKAGDSRAGKNNEMDFPLESLERTTSGDTGVKFSKTYFGFLTSRAMRHWILSCYSCIGFINSVWQFVTVAEEN
jgi:hypothetical protein